MTHDSSWRLGAAGNPIDRAYDALRRGLNRDLVAFLLDNALAGQADARVLESGSGTAYASSLLRQGGAVRMAAALDHDPNALAEGRARDSALAAVCGDMTRLPFASGTFDLVWNSSTLEHLPDPLAGLREMARVARPGGHVFVGVPFAGGPLGVQRWMANTPAGVWIGPVFSQASLSALMRQAGLVPGPSRVYFWRFFIGILAAKPGDA